MKTPAGQCDKTDACVQAFKGLKGVIMSALFGTLAPEGNPHLLAALRYPIIDPSRPPAPSTQVGMAYDAGVCTHPLPG